MHPHPLTRRLALASLALASPLARAATLGSGRSATEARTLGAIDEVTVSMGLNLVITQGPEQRLDVTADDNLLPLLETVLSGSRLHLRWRRGESVVTRSSPQARLQVVSLRALACEGSGRIELQALKGERLAAAISGSGDMRLRGLDLRSLALAISGSGDLLAQGAAQALSVSIAGSGNVDSTALQAPAVTVSIAGSGDARVQAGQTLAVDIAGSGDVRYAGNASVSSRIAGSGTVKKL